jgi:CubicO group peptidase (beta-lactamase class C family)
MICPSSRLLFAVASALLIATTLPAQFVGYHDVSSSSHQASFTSLTGQGYRLKQLSVAGGLATPRYSAIWVQESGPAWVSSHGMTQAAYSTWRTNWLNQGYRAKIVTAAGSGANTVFAAVFVNDGVAATDVIANSEASFEAVCTLNREGGRIAVSVDIHGTDTAPLYCAVWEPNTNNTVWGWKVDAVHADFADTWNAYYPVNARIAALGMSDSQRYVSIWHDDRVGAWATRSNYTSSGYATQYTTLTNAGYEPIVIASGGTGTGLRVSGCFAQSRTPLPRAMTYTGQYRSQFAAFDTYMTNAMQSSGARNAALAITKDGRLVFARGYTWGEAGTQVTQPTSVFRIASLTKVLTSMAIHEMVDDGLVSLNDQPKALIGAPNGTTNFNNCTLRNCLEYTSGLIRDYSGIPIADFATTGTPILPATHWQGIQWLAVQPVQHTLGNWGEYSNSAFLLASQVVRQTSGYGSMQSYLQAKFYNPLGITRARVAASEIGSLPSDEIRGYTTELNLAKSNRHTDQRLLPKQWTVDFALADGSGGMAFAVVDWARLMAGTFGLGSDWITLSPARVTSMLTRDSFPVWQEGPGNVTPGSFSWSQRPNGVWAYHKGGGLSDAHTRAMWRSDGISITVFVAKGGSSTDDPDFHTMAEQVTNWPTDDLFPNYGMPTFPRRPALTSVNTAVLPNVTNTPFVLTGERLDTVTSVNFGGTVVTATTTSNWHNGWFRSVNPTTLEFFPPQGLAGGTRGLSVANTVGSSSTLLVQLTTATGGPHLSAPPTVTSSQSFRVYAGAGTAPTPSLAALVLSTSPTPSSAPGIVDLQIGAQFSDVIATDFLLFDANRAAWWQIPPLPWPSVHLQAAIFDPVTAAPFPLPTTNVRTPLRQ